MTLQELPIGDFLDHVSNWKQKDSPADDTFRYIDLSSIDQDTKEIRLNGEIPVKHAPSRARQILKPKDILVSTVRPNLNGVAFVPEECDGAIGSTGFCVLRPKPKKLCNRYLFHWVRSPQFVTDMTKKATGQSYPAVSDKIVKESLIPLPADIDEQKRIAAILDQADSIRRARRQAVEKFSSLSQAIFYEMFGGNRATMKISDCLEDIQSGKNLVGVSDDVSSGYRVLKISSVSRYGFRPSETKPLPAGYVPPSKHIVSNGDLLFSRANTSELVGIPCIVEGVSTNVALPDKLWRLIPSAKKANKIFLNYALRSASSRRQIEGMCSGTSGSMQNISMQKFNKIEIPKASLEEQRIFAKKIVSVKQTSQYISKHLSISENLFLSLQQRAFRGEL